MQSQQNSSMPELTLRVFIVGILLSIVMGAANVYIGLKAGMTVSASIPAAVMAMLIFRALGSKSLLEANQVQTAASAGESLAAGIIFTMPALILIGAWEEFDYWMVTAVAFTGGLLGILLMIPMRKVFVVDNEELAYPEGIACAAVLQAGDSEDSSEESASEAKALIFGGIVGALFKVGVGLFGVFKEALETAFRGGDRIFFAGTNILPMLVGVGFIVRLNVAILIFMGGAIGWLIGIPLLGGAEAHADNLVDGAYDLWNLNIRYVGVGAMVVGGFASIVSVRSGLMAAIRHLTGGAAKGDTSNPRNRDLPGGVIGFLAITSVVLIAMVYFQFTNSVPITAMSVAAMLLMSFFMTAVASYIVGLVGNSNSPVSGMTITAVLFTGGMLLLTGFSGDAGRVATLGVAAIVCCVACTSGDVCNDLKTGHLVGAAPYRQQIMQVVGVAVASLTMAPVLTLLHSQYTIGSKDLPAPQAGLFASLAEGLFPDPGATSTLPWNMIGYGAAVGVLILIADAILKKRGSGFRMYLMPIAVGMYLPFALAPPILIGGIIAAIIARGCKTEEETTARLHRGVLFSSGIIAGEALLGVAVAALAGAGIGQMDLGLAPEMVTYLTAGVAILILILFFTVSSARRKA